MEKRQEGFWRVFGRRWAKVVFSPHSFFCDISGGRSLKEPFIFAVTCRFLIVLSTAIIGFLGRNFIVNFAPKAIMVYNIPLTVSSYWWLQLVVLVTAPILIFASAALLHIAVLALRGREGFRATFRVIAYSNAATLFAVVPIAGWFFSFLYNIMLIALGLKYVGRISTLKAITAVIILMLALSLISFFALFFLFAKYKRFI